MIEHLVLIEGKCLYHKGFACRVVLFLVSLMFFSWVVVNDMGSSFSVSTFMAPWKSGNG